MARLASRTIKSQDEQWDFEGKAARQLELLLKKLKVDTYNHEYIVTITVDQVDEPLPEKDYDADASEADDD